MPRFNIAMRPEGIKWHSPLLLIAFGVTMLAPQGPDLCGPRRSRTSAGAAGAAGLWARPILWSIRWPPRGRMVVDTADLLCNRQAPWGPDIRGPSRSLDKRLATFDRVERVAYIVLVRNRFQSSRGSCARRPKSHPLNPQEII